MGWATRRKFIYATGVLLFLGAAGFSSWYFFFYTPPSCSDGIQNQGEFGVDCDGPCVKMCTPPRVDALWARSVKVANGVYHAVALVKNPVAKGRGTDLEYLISLFDEKNILVATRRGVFDLEPGETRAVFEPSIITGERIPIRAIVKITGGSWQRAEAVQSPIRIVEQGVPDSENLNLSAIIENTTAEPVTTIVVDALLYDADDVLVTASETRIPVLQARERREITFTWSEPFSRPVIRADIQIRTAHAALP